ncbi:hypothetical protein [Verminephrobacter eiseniae]|uniref:hypothetical protein n=1 Tax=Verminephrobacter eiseniae TaxID=364317 RepID=UPI0022370482|nr:hypothetical protein [Verminephrobacter eiseniae]MCW5234926.1 hypothetical protein [Verminephrobacter eiseniae]
MIVAPGSAGAVWAQAPIQVGVIFPLSDGSGLQGRHVTQALEAMAALIDDSGGGKAPNRSPTARRPWPRLRCAACSKDPRHEAVRGTALLRSDAP